MEFLNVGGGEILVIILLALILFGPEDIMKMMRTLGKYTRSARDMWNSFNKNLQEEYAASQELTDIIDETKGVIEETKEVLGTVKTSVDEISTAVTADVADAEKAVKASAEDSAAALHGATREAAQAAQKHAIARPSSQKPAPPEADTQVEVPAPAPVEPDAALASADAAAGSEDKSAATAQPEEIEAPDAAEPRPTEIEEA